MQLNTLSTIDIVPKPIRVEPSTPQALDDPARSLPRAPIATYLLSVLSRVAVLEKTTQTRAGDISRKRMQD